MVRHVVFDMGNVLKEFNEDNIIRKFANEEEEAQEIYKTLFLSGIWAKLDKGTISYEEAKQELSKVLPKNLYDKAADLLDNWHYHMPVDPRMEAIVARLKHNGYSLYLLSNASVRFSEYQQTTEVFKYFDGFVVSAFHKTVKPEKRIYEILFNTYHLIPSECVFIDDNAENVAAGNQLGMPSHLFDGNIEKMYNFFEKHKVHYGKY